MSDQQGKLSAVFNILREIPEIGGRAGDKIVLRPSVEGYTYALVRDLGPIASDCWAFTDACELEVTDPPMMDDEALRLLREGVDDHGLVGLHDGDEERREEESERIDPALARLYRLSPEEDERCAHLFLAESPIPDTCVRQGDYLTYTTYGKVAEPLLRGAVAVRVPRAQLATVEAHFDCLRVLHVQWNPDYGTEAEQLRKMRQSLRRRQNPKWKDSTSPLLIVRPLVAPVSEPIEATSDDAALFELLCQVGGKMPPGEEAPHV